MNRRIMIVLLVAIPIAAGTFLVYQQFATPQRTINLNGAGASFPFPLIDKWVSEYSKIKPNIIINYQSIG
ncbi:MAG: phosphate ABC transporter substrate-binding protein PstS, partial [Candidatus Brockarchaeota archaeon]|nr:phosphate ABC transporter substrate-binding protein PstS [Candidatus Brockarchaeota archaeon]